MSTAAAPLTPKRLGVYIDAVYDVVPTPEGRTVSTDRSFLLFVSAVGESFKSLTLFGRTRSSLSPADYVLPPEVELVDLPHYENLRRVHEVAARLSGTLFRFWRGLDRVDVVWVFGPHPIAVAFAGLALARGKKVVLGIRQDSVRLYAARLPGARWLPARIAVRAVEAAFRLLAQRVPATVQGAELARRYAGGRAPVHTMTESVVGASDISAEPLERDWNGTIEFLTVGRLETEKNPLLLVEAFAALTKERPGAYRLTWIGRGPLEADVKAHVQRLGITELIDFHGYVPFDAGLLDLYRRANAFVHVSLSEGVPKVLIEALACSTPLVATDVGGIRAALGDDEVALLVPPNDREALTAAMRRILDQADLRSTLALRGLELARSLTLEAEAARVVDFIQSET